MKTKIVEYIAGEAQHKMCDARGEATNMFDRYPALKNRVDPGIGLDFAVLREKLEEAANLINLLTKKGGAE